MKKKVIMIVSAVAAVAAIGILIVCILANRKYSFEVVDYEVVKMGAYVYINVNIKNTGKKMVYRGSGLSNITDGTLYGDNGKEYNEGGLVQPEYTKRIFRRGESDTVTCSFFAPDPGTYRLEFPLSGVRIVVDDIVIE